MPLTRYMSHNWITQEALRTLCDLSQSLYLDKIDLLYKLHFCMHSTRVFETVCSSQKKICSVSYPFKRIMKFERNSDKITTVAEGINVTRNIEEIFSKTFNHYSIYYYFLLHFLYFKKRKRMYSRRTNNMVRNCHQSWCL